LLCAALKWLGDHRDDALSDDEEEEDDNDEDDKNINDNTTLNDNKNNVNADADDWVMAHFKATRAKAKLDRVERRNAARRNERVKLNELRTRHLQQRRQPLANARSSRATATTSNVAPPIDDEFLLLEPIANRGADEISDAVAMTRSLLPDATSSAAMRAVAELLASRAKKRTAAGSLDAEPNESFEERKVFYCARTHSQLSQFVEELRRTAWVTDLKCIPLGARKNLCVNESVLHLRDATQINDKCDELRRAGQCPYVTEQPRVDAARDAMLATQPDIESALDIGQRAHACAYYAARAAVPHAELIVLPYQLVVQKEAREALGLRLRGNIVILDECHNVAGAIASSHESELDAAQLDAAHAHLDSYLHKYGARLSPVNVNSIRQLLFVCRQLTRVIGEAGAANESSLSTLAAFVFRARIDNLNLFELERYFAESQVVRKVQGFARLAEQQAVTAHGSAARSAASATRMMWSLAAVRRFLLTLTASEADARVLVAKADDNKRVVLRCVMLSAARPCLELCAEARAVAFCGGTVAPRNAFISDLFGERVAAATDGVDGGGDAATETERTAHERLRFFSCGHVVSRESVLLSVLPKGPTGVSFNFAYAERGDERRIGELGTALVNLCAVVPNGVVVFFTSYAYEAQVVDAWTRAGVLARLASRKAVHRDRRTRATAADANSADEGADDAAESDAVSALLTRYAADARTERGALLTAVMGGRLSEGINFKDELARCVVVVGVPFPPANDALFDEKVRRAAAATRRSTDETRTRMMNDVAMKTVNQAIGRALRHRGDFASIVLADERFARPALRDRLPQWLAASLETNSEATYGTFTRSLAQFFQNKKQMK
jgi:chromosome transmission fidelity protein 1